MLVKDSKKSWKIPLIACVPLVFLSVRRIENKKIQEGLQEENLLDYHQKSRRLKNHLAQITQVIDSQMK